MRIFTIVCKVLFGVILFMPVLGILGIFPPPTQDLYNTDGAFNFILVLMEGKYIPYINALVCIAGIILMCMKRTLLAMLLTLPLTVNVVAFHAFLDGGLLTGGAVLGNIMAIINVYLIWVNREQLKVLGEADRG